MEYVLSAAVVLGLLYVVIYFAVVNAIRAAKDPVVPDEKPRPWKRD